MATVKINGSGAYPTIQAALTNLGGIIAEDTIIEVSASAGGAETVAGFTVSSMTFTEGVKLTIRGEAGHAITIDGDGSGGVVINGGEGSYRIENFTFVDSNGTPATEIIEIRGTSSSVRIDKVELEQITVNNQLGCVRMSSITTVELTNVLIVSSAAAYGALFISTCDTTTISGGNIQSVIGSGSTAGIYIDNTFASDGNTVSITGAVVTSASYHGIRTIKVDAYAVSRCTVKNCGSYALSHSVKVQVGSVVTIQNCAFYANGNYILYCTEADVVTLQNNTFKIHATANAGLYFHDVGTVYNYKNIYWVTPESDTSFIKYRYDSTTGAIDRLFSDFNLYFRTLGENSHDFIESNIPEIGYNNDFAEWQTDSGKDTNSQFADPLFGEDIELQETSPARNALDTDNTVEFDVRGYYRQDQYQDIGAWDYDAQAGSKPADDGAGAGTIYRDSDSAEYTSVRSAMIAQNGQTQDETIIINTLVEQIGVWFSSRTSNGFTLTVKGKDDLGGRAVIGSNSGVAMSIEGVDNILFENIHFKGSGTDFAAVRIGLAQVNSVIFRNCKFSDADNGVYLYVGDTIEFYDCEFTEVTQYPMFATSVRNLLLHGCTLGWGTQDPTLSSGNVFSMFLSSLTGRTLIENCTFTDAKQDRVFKSADVEDFTFRGNLVADTKQSSFWCVRNGEISVGKLIIENNIFDNIATNATTGRICQVDKAGPVYIIGNTFKTPIYNDAILIREGTEKLYIYNNYFEITNPIALSGQYLIQAVLIEDGELETHFFMDNNSFVSDETDGDNIGYVSVAFEEGSTVVMKTLSALQDGDYELAGYEDRQSPLVSQIDVDYKPVLGSDLIANGDAAKAGTTLDFNRKVRDNGQSIGAVNYEVTGPPAQHTFEFVITNKASNESYESDDPLVVSIEVPYTDDIHLRSVVEVIPDVVKWQVKMQTSPHDIDSLDFAGNIVKVAGDITDETEFVSSVTLTGTNAGTYRIALIMYSGAEAKTLFFLQDDLVADVIDGQISYENLVLSKIGQAVNFQFDQKDKTYDFYCVAVKSGQTDVEHDKDSYFTTLEARPVADFYQSAYLVYEGDNVSFFSSGFAAEEYLWEIETPSGIITRTTENVLDIPFTAAGVFSVKLTIGNGIGYSSVLEKPEGVVCEAIPARPVVNFNIDKEVIFADGSVQCRLFTDPSGENRITRFLQPNDIVKWVIRSSDTKQTVYSTVEQEPTIDWTADLSGITGEFDVVLRIHASWGGTEIIRRRLITVYPDLTGKTVHTIALSEGDTWDDGSGVQYGTYLNGTASAYSHNESDINEGDVILLSGTTRQLRFDHIVGTADNPVIVIPDCSGDETVKISVRGWQGIMFLDCEHVYMVGKENNGGLEYGFEVFTNPDPLIYMAAPFNHGLKIDHFSKEVRICGMDIHDMKFAGMAAKTDPKSNDPTTWRNDPTGGFNLSGVRIHHNHIHDTEGEGIYFGYYTSHAVGTGVNSLGQTVDYYAHVLTDLMIYRNKFIDNGYDAIQVGNCIGPSEIHDNLLLNSGHANVFGQNSGMSMGYFIGEIYNNLIDNVIQFGAYQQGTVKIYNNLLDSIHGRNHDVVYLHIEPNPRWNYNVTPPIITDAQDSLAECKFEIFNNVILAKRQPIQANCKIWQGFMPNKIDVMNNIVVILDYSWNNTRYADDNPNRDTYLSNEMNTHLTSKDNSVMSGNIIKKYSEIDWVKFLSITNMNTRLAPTSPAIAGGYNLESRLTGELFDADGYTIPTLTGSFARGMYSFMPINYTYISPENLGENILYRIWSTDSNRWVLGIVECIEDIDPTIAPDESGETVDATSLCILKDHSPKPFPTSAKAHGVKGDVRYSENKIALCVNDNTWLFANRTSN